MLAKPNESGMTHFSRGAWFYFKQLRYNQKKFFFLKALGKQADMKLRNTTKFFGKSS